MGAARGGHGAGALSVVQAVLSTGVVMLAVLAERVFGFKVGRRQKVGVGLTALGLVLLVVTLPHAPGSHSNFSLPAMIAFEAGMLTLGALLHLGKRLGAPDHHHGVLLGAAAGILFGVSDVSIKALTGLDGAAGDPRLARGSRSRSSLRSSPSTPPPAASRTAKRSP